MRRLSGCHAIVTHLGGQLVILHICTKKATLCTKTVFPGEIWSLAYAKTPIVGNIKRKIPYNKAKNSFCDSQKMANNSQKIPKNGQKFPIIIFFFATPPKKKSSHNGISWGIGWHNTTVFCSNVCSTRAYCGDGEEVAAAQC